MAKSILDDVNVQPSPTSTPRRQQDDSTTIVDTTAMVWPGASRGWCERSTLTPAAGRGGQDA